MSNILPFVPGDGVKGKRWKAVLTYRVEGGVTARDVYFEEIAELHDIIERGPHWDTLVSCLITLDRVSVSADLTIEGSMEL